MATIAATDAHSLGVRMAGIERQLAGISKQIDAMHKRLNTMNCRVNILTAASIAHSFAIGALAIAIMLRT